jgi:hypothetical protein
MVPPLGVIDGALGGSGMPGTIVTAPDGFDVALSPAAFVATTVH